MQGEASTKLNFAHQFRTFQYPGGRDQGRLLAFAAVFLCLFALALTRRPLFGCFGLSPDCDVGFRMSILYSFQSCL